VKDERTGPAIVRAGPTFLLFARRTITLNTSHSANDDLPSVTIDPEVYRQLIQQFYESSIQRYGADSEQSRMLEQHLTAHSSEAA